MRIPMTSTRRDPHACLSFRPHLLPFLSPKQHPGVFSAIGRPRRVVWYPWCAINPVRQSVFGCWDGLILTRFIFCTLRFFLLIRSTMLIPLIRLLRRHRHPNLALVFSTSSARSCSSAIFDFPSSLTWHCPRLLEGLWLLHQDRVFLRVGSSSFLLDSIRLRIRPRPDSASNQSSKKVSEPDSA